MESGRRPDPHAYVEGMDASTVMKLDEASPHIKGGIEVDFGCGAGLLTIRIAQQYPGSRVIGVELLEYLAKESAERINKAHVTNCTIIQGDMCAPMFRPGTIDTALAYSVGHHLYTYNGYNYDALRLFLARAYEALKPGGRIIFRDGLEPNHYTTALHILPSPGSINITDNPEDLSTEGMLLRFARDFPQAVALEPTGMHKKPVYLMSSEHAYEFMMKKDFRANWPVEVREVYGYWTTQQFLQEFREAGFRNVSATPITNKWIVKNRLEPAMEVYHYSTLHMKFYKWHFPYTHVLVVAEK